MTLEERALSLLLRSPRLTVTQILELLDIGDSEFRRIADRNADVANLLAARRNGELRSERASPKQCPSCSDWFVPYGSSRFCSDTCATIGRLQHSA